MLYTGKGDRGTTKLFNTPAGERVSKGDIVFEALGTVDELNAYVGLLKVKVENMTFSTNNEEKSISHMLHNIQETLFIIQAELAGAGMTVEKKHTDEISDIVDQIEKTLPPITTFFISGGTEIAALSDVIRTISRRCERLLVRVSVEKEGIVGEYTLSYINRLSSVFYALSRLFNHEAGVSEIPPGYRKE